MSWKDWALIILPIITSLIEAYLGSVKKSPNIQAGSILELAKNALTGKKL
jgi:hypothetical protein